jgi:hypothetical protein
MKTHVLVWFAVPLFLGFDQSLWADPQITSWFIVDSGQFARIYRTDADRLAGTSETTWSNGRLSQATPADCGVQGIYSSANWIYVRSTGLGSQVMGPWYNDAQHRRLFPNLPVDQHLNFAFPRHPVASTTAHLTTLGAIGLGVDGVEIFDSRDAFSYSHAAGRDGDPRAGIGQGDQVWFRNAYVLEGKTFDPAYAHQPQFGAYHYHAEPIALRYLLGDHVDMDAATKTYHESSAPVARHSPILGWLADGYPVYGPYAYSNPTNPASGIRRMVSGYVLRDGGNGEDDLTHTGRRTLPAWDARELNRSAQLAEAETGPNVNSLYPLGRYIEDYAYLGDLGNVPGNAFDLDEMNGRWCVTPEFPEGTYAYFTTIDAEGKPVYPYTVGRRFHGNPNGRLVRRIGEPVTTNFLAPATGPVPPSAAESRALTWNSATGTYDSR